MELFTKDKPVMFNYHGYPAELQGLLFGRLGMHRMQVNGYQEEGSTTTPFDMMLLNAVSRFDVAKRALTAGAESNEEVKAKLNDYLGDIDKRVQGVRCFISDNGKGKLHVLTLHNKETDTDFRRSGRYVRDCQI